MIPKKPKKLRANRKTLVKKLDGIVGDIVKLRDKNCVTCPIWRNEPRRKPWIGSSILEPGHLFSRVAYSTRWKLTNVFCQCRNCNMLHESDTFALTKYFLDKFGQQAYDELHQLYSQPAIFKDFQLEEMYTILKEEYEKLKGGDNTQ